MITKAPDVSRETQDVLASYADMLLQWNTTHNLISKASEPEIWSRHIADSAQIFDLAPSEARSWIDLGSGAGLPGLVCAVLAVGRGRHTEFTLVESNTKKATFLKAASRSLGLEINVENRRIESVDSSAFDVVSARALAPLTLLLGYAERFRGPRTICLFPKGRTVDTELSEAQKHWNFSAEPLPSRTDDSSVILRIQEFENVRASRRDE